MDMNRIKLKTIACIALTLGLASCSVYKYVPEGGYLLWEDIRTSHIRHLTPAGSACSVCR